MRLEIVQVGDPVLRQPADPVPHAKLATPFLQELVASMVQTMRAAPGVGLAAPQVGEPLQVMVMADDDEEFLGTMSQARRDELRRHPLPLLVVVNPVLELVGHETDEFFEGCLSLPGFTALVRRRRRARLSGLDQHGNPVQHDLEGWPARIAQHECDHLAGTLYVDRMDPRTFTTAANASRHWKARPASEVHGALDRPEPPSPDPPSG